MNPTNHEPRSQEENKENLVPIEQANNLLAQLISRQYPPAPVQPERNKHE